MTDDSFAAFEQLYDSLTLSDPNNPLAWEKEELFESGTAFWLEPEGFKPRPIIALWFKRRESPTPESLRRKIRSWLGNSGHALRVRFKCRKNRGLQKSRSSDKTRFNVQSRYTFQTCTHFDRASVWGPKVSLKHAQLPRKMTRGKLSIAPPDDRRFVRSRGDLARYNECVISSQDIEL